MFEWDENVAFEEEATYIGRIGSTRKNAIQLEGLPKPYWQYKELFEDEKGEMLAPRRTIDHTIELKEGATPPRARFTPCPLTSTKNLTNILRKC